MIPLITSIAILAGSLAALIFFAELVVRSAIRISEITQIHRFAIGLLTIAFMTSLPETSVAVSSVLLGEPDVSISNVLGSNITNLCLIGGLLAILRPLTIASELRAILPMLLAITGIFALLWLRGFSMVVGIILIAIFFIHCRRVLRKAITVQAEGRRRIDRELAISLAISFVLLWFGILGLFASASYVVKSVVAVAELAGIAATAVGATVIALGTSLPELSVDLTACKRGEVELALGDVLGSCVVNVTLILGITLAFSAEVNPDPYLGLFVFLMVTTGIFWVIARRGRMGMLAGTLLLGLYCLYLATVGYVTG